MKKNREALKTFIQRGTGACRVCVVGDVMLDKYYYGEVTRISPEAPVPVTRVVRTKETLGGAANVAHNLALLGCHTTVAGYIGDDYHGTSLLARFKRRGIRVGSLVKTAAPTTTKLRVIGGHQQMMRLDFEETGPVPEREEARLIQKAEKSLAAGAGRHPFRLRQGGLYGGGVHRCHRGCAPSWRAGRCRPKGRRLGTLPGS